LTQKRRSFLRRFCLQEGVSIALVVEDVPAGAAAATNFLKNIYRNFYHNTEPGCIIGEI